MKDFLLKLKIITRQFEEKSRYSKKNEENLDILTNTNNQKLMKKKIIYHNENNITETIRIYATNEMLDILVDANYNQYFLDGTFRCVPRGCITL